MIYKRRLEAENNLQTVTWSWERLTNGDLKLRMTYKRWLEAENNLQTVTWSWEWLTNGDLKLRMTYKRWLEAENRCDRECSVEAAEYRTKQHQLADTVRAEHDGGISVRLYVRPTCRGVGKQQA